MNFFEKYNEQIDIYLKGESFKAYTFMGAHLNENGCDFAVYAPCADRVTLTGDFNGWKVPGEKMEFYKGIWHVFIPDLKAGTAYKFAVEKNNTTVLKSDPFAFYSELRPNNASLVYDLCPFDWTDGEYLKKKASVDFLNSPVNIYEVHLGSFKQGKDGSFLNFREIVPYLTNHALEMGYNYIELMPITEHPLDESWGYQTTGYYSVSSRYGTPADFQYFVNYLHNAGIGVISDWVPGHFCRDLNGLYRFDGTACYESENSDKADNPGWGTLNFDFCKPHVRSFLASDADYLLSVFHIDGIRADAVANMLSFDFGKKRTASLKNQYGGYENVEAVCFLKDLNTYIKSTYPHAFTSAEDSSARGDITSPCGLNFTFKWNLGWMNDSLSYMKKDPIYRKSLHDKMTFLLFYAFSEHFILPLSHDEVVHGKCSMLEKMPGYRVDKFAQLRAFYTFMYGMPGKKLQFMGNEFGHSLEWRFYESLEWDLLKFNEYASLKAYSASLNHIYLKDSALWAKDTGWEGFSWCDACDRDASIYSFVRYGKTKEDTLVFAINFTPVHHERYKLGVPYFCEYKEILNSDDAVYGGKNRKNLGFLIPAPEGKAEMPYSLTVNLAPFGAIILKPFDTYKSDTDIML